MNERKPYVKKELEEELKKELEKELDEEELKKELEKEMIKSLILNNINVNVYENYGKIGIFVPMKPLYDHDIEIIMKPVDNGYILTDDGETFTQIFVNTGEGTFQRNGKEINTFSDKQQTFINNILSLHDISRENDELSIKCTRETFNDSIMRFIMAIIQIYAVLNINKDDGGKESED